MKALRVLAIALLLQAGLFAQSNTSSLQGNVVTVGNSPIANAAVELRSLEVGARVYTTTSERDGRFSFRNIPPGRYQLTAIRGGYVRGDYGLHGPGTSGIAITLVARQPMQDVRLALRTAGAITGRITDLHGEGVGNVHVKALRFSYQDGHTSLVDVKSVFTNDLGEYRLGWLPPGRYNVSALHPDAPFVALNFPEIINSATIVGTVVTNAGGMNGGSFNASGNLDPALRARIGLTAGENYVPVYYPGTLDQRAASGIDVGDGAEVTGVDLTVAPIHTASITGYVRPLPASDGTPVRLQLLVSRSPSYDYRTQGIPVDPQTGAFSITGLAPGAFVLAATIGGGNARLTGHTFVTTGEGSTENVDVALERGVSIPARVVIDGDASVRRASGVRVGVRTDPVIPGIAESFYSAAAADGSVTLDNVTPGDYLVSVLPLMTLGPVRQSPAPPAVPGPSFSPPDLIVDRTVTPAGAYVKSIRVGDTDVLNGRLHVDGRPFTAPVEVVIGTNAGQLNGVVVDERRRPAANVTVVLVPKPDRRQRGDLYKVTSTDAAGRFRIESIPPDDYTVFAWEDVETNAWLDPQFMQTVEGRGQAIRVGEGVTVAVEVASISAGR